MEGSKTIKKEIRIITQDHSSKKKAEVINTYLDNDFDAEKTAKQSGVSPVLVKEWYRQSGLEVFKGKSQEVTSYSAGIQANKDKIAAEVSLELVKGRQIVIERLIIQIEKCNDPDITIKALDAITRAIKEDKEDSTLLGRGIKKNGTYNIINNQYNTRKLNKKDGSSKV